jgi:hypothetical protein
MLDCNELKDRSALLERDFRALMRSSRLDCNKERKCEHSSVSCLDQRKHAVEGKIIANGEMVSRALPRWPLSGHTQQRMEIGREHRADLLFIVLWFHLSMQLNRASPYNPHPAI